MDNYTDARGNTLRETTSRMLADISIAQREVEEFKHKHETGISDYFAQDAELFGQVEKSAKNCRRAQEIITQTLNKLPSNVDNAAQHFRTRITLATSEHSRGLRKDTEVLGAAASGTFERLEKSRLLRLDELAAIRDNSVQTHQNTKQSVSSVSKVFHEAEHGLAEVVSVKILNETRWSVLSPT